MHSNARKYLLKVVFVLLLRPIRAFIRNIAFMFFSDSACAIHCRPRGVLVISAADYFSCLRQKSGDRSTPYPLPSYDVVPLLSTTRTNSLYIDSYICDYFTVSKWRLRSALLRMEAEAEVALSSLFGLISSELMVTIPVSM